MTELFRLTQADVGRPITDFGVLARSTTTSPGICAPCSANLQPVRRGCSHEDCWYDVRMRSHRTADDRIDGVVITFVDITERRRMEDALRDSEHQLRQQKRLVEMSREPIHTWDFDGGIVDWNRGCEELYGYPRQEAGQTQGAVAGHRGAGLVTPGDERTSDCALGIGTASCANAQRMAGC